jgi:hypothetical protein
MIIIDIIFELILFIFSFVLITDQKYLTLNINKIQMANVIRVYKLSGLILKFHHHMYTLFIFVIKSIYDLLGLSEPNISLKWLINIFLYYYQLTLNNIDKCSKYVISLVKCF